MSSHGWHIAGYSVAVLFTIMGAWTLVDAVRGLSGQDTGKVRFECDRAQGECRSIYPLRTVKFALADVTGVDVKSKRQAIGRGGRFETVYALALNLRDKDKDGLLSQWTGDEASLAKLRDGASKIQSFLAGNEPTLSLKFGTKESHLSNWGSLLAGVLMFAVVGVILYFVRRGR